MVHPYGSSHNVLFYTFVLHSFHLLRHLSETIYCFLYEYSFSSHEMSSHLETVYASRKRPLKTIKEFSISEDHVQRRSEEHTSELQSRFDIVCRLLLE